MISYSCQENRHGSPPDADPIDFGCSGYANVGDKVGPCECACHKTQEEVDQINERAREAARNPKGRPWQ